MAAGNLLYDPSFEADLGRWRGSEGAHLAVIHVTHRSGAALAIEMAVELPTDVTVFVDDPELRVTRSSSKP